MKTIKNLQAISFTTALFSLLGLIATLTYGEINEPCVLIWILIILTSLVVYMISTYLVKEIRKARRREMLRRKRTCILPELGNE